jgi:hypothetical protein
LAIAQEIDQIIGRFQRPLGTEDIVNVSESFYQVSCYELSRHNYN